MVRHKVFGALCDPLYVNISGILKLKVKIRPLTYAHWKADKIETRKCECSYWTIGC